jgi:hypothetical protein
MKLKNDWLPYDLDGRASRFRAIAGQIDQFASPLGLTPAQVMRIKQIAEAYDYAYSVVHQAETATKALVAWRRAVMDQKTRVGQAAPAPPSFPAYNVPAGTTIGMVAEMRRYVRLMKASPGFSSMIGEALGIMPPPDSQLSLAEISPNLKLTTMDGGRLTVRCVMMTMDALRLEYSPAGAERAWRLIGFFTTLPATVKVDLAADTLAEAGHVRGIFMKKNQTVGKMSPIMNVTFTK